MARVVFMGTPAFAVPVLEALDEAHEVVGVVTQPDRPAGRGRRLMPSPVKEVALGRGLEIMQPASLRPPGVVEQLAGWRPDATFSRVWG